MYRQARILYRQSFLLALAPRRDLQHLPYCGSLASHDTVHFRRYALKIGDYTGGGEIQWLFFFFVLFFFFFRVYCSSTQIYTATYDDGVMLCCAARDIVVTFAGAQSKRKPQTINVVSEREGKTVACCAKTDANKN